MLLVVGTWGLLIAMATVIHYEVLRTLNPRLAALSIPNRTKLLAVIFAAFAAHGIEISLYGAALFVLGKYMGVGTLSCSAGFSLMDCMYFWAETYTSLGFGDLTPVGPIRLVAGVEALNGLLLVGWSASFTYIAMERFWAAGDREKRV